VKNLQGSDNAVTVGDVTVFSKPPGDDYHWWAHEMQHTLVSHQQLHQSRLVEHISVFEAWRLSTAAPALPGSPRFNYLGQLTSGQPAGLGLLYHVVQAQASMLAFNDIYRAIAFALIPLIPLFLLLPRSRNSGHVAAH
jgi:hypothetical protein